jgi:predicted DNA-binding transcriptional regulator YafY
VPKGDLGRPRPSGEPQSGTVRKIGILLDLLRNKRISMRGSAVTYGSSERSIQRDLQELRNIGKTAGFQISERLDGDYFELTKFEAKPSRLSAGQRRLQALVAELLKAFGAPVQDVASGLTDGDASLQPRFLHLVQPQLTDGSTVAETYKALEAAWQSDARVEFGYRGKRRTVEPAAAVVRAGRYYLVGRDLAKGRAGWRNFSMDLIEPPIVRRGSFTRAAPPAKYLSADTVGFFKGDGPATTVDITLSAAVAASATSRVWQEAQRARSNRDGTVTISFSVDDVDEVVRWALGYGDEAWISAPPSVVARAREMLAEMQRRYRKAPPA